LGHSVDRLGWVRSLKNDPRTSLSEVYVTITKKKYCHETVVKGGNCKKG